MTASTSNNVYLVNTYSSVYQKVSFTPFDEVDVGKVPR